jgi:hypothetical protein
MGAIQTSSSGQPEYHKIDTLFERTEDFRVDETKLRHPVIRTISEWDVTEKIDGTNVRVMLSDIGAVSIGGRSNSAQMPADLLMTLVSQFPADRMKATFWLTEPVSAVLFGEGYGAGIQKGGVYRPDKAFILFDVLVAGKWWLDKEAVDDVAAKLGCDTVPYLGRMTLNQITERVRFPFASQIGTGIAEGIVARPVETLFDKKGARLIIKLKTKDFRIGRAVHTAS